MLIIVIDIGLAFIITRIDVSDVFIIKSETGIVVFIVIIIYVDAVFLIVCDSNTIFIIIIDIVFIFISDVGIIVVISITDIDVVCISLLLILALYSSLLVTSVMFS